VKAGEVLWVLYLWKRSYWPKVAIGCHPFGLLLVFWEAKAGWEAQPKQTLDMRSKALLDTRNFHFFLLVASYDYTNRSMTCCWDDGTPKYSCNHAKTWFQVCSNGDLVTCQRTRSPSGLPYCHPFWFHRSCSISWKALIQTTCLLQYYYSTCQLIFHTTDRQIAPRPRYLSRKS
jgi:hypothetical protein